MFTKENVIRGLFLLDGEQGLYALFVYFGDESKVVEVALLLFGLLGQDVTVVSVTSFDLTRSGERETLLGAGISLYFWHFLLFVCC